MKKNNHNNCVFSNWYRLWFFWSGYYISKKIFRKTKRQLFPKSTNSEQPLITNGEYQVTANWDWKTLVVKDNVWTLDGKRIYDVSTTNDNIVILKGKNLKSLVVYKIEKKITKKINLYSYTKRRRWEKKYWLL